MKPYSLGNLDFGFVWPQLLVLQGQGPIVEVRSDQPLDKGLTILFDETYTGVVIGGSEERYQVNLFQPVVVNQARVKNWWQPKQPKTRVLATPLFFTNNLDSNQTASLYAVAKLPAKHVPGCLGWSLLYQARRDGEVIALVQGNDYRTPGVCEFSTKGQWRPGIYTLYARRFHDQGYLKQSEDHVTWIVSRPVNQLGSGLGDLSNDSLNLV